LCGVPFADCLTDIGETARTIMMKAKRNEYSLEDARIMSKEYMVWIDEMRAKAPNMLSFTKEKNLQAEKVLNDVLMKVIKFGLRKEIVSEENSLYVAGMPTTV